MFVVEVLVFDMCLVSLWWHHSFPCIAGHILLSGVPADALVRGGAGGAQGAVRTIAKSDEEHASLTGGGGGVRRRHLARPP